MLAKVLDLAKKAVKCGENDPLGLPWALQALGYAEYRNGHYAEAEKVLAGAENRAGFGFARLFRIMCLFRLDKSDEARTLFHQFEAKSGQTPWSWARNGAQIVPHDALISLFWSSRKRKTCWMRRIQTILDFAVSGH